MPQVRDLFVKNLSGLLSQFVLSLEIDPDFFLQDFTPYPWQKMEENMFPTDCC